MKFNLIRCDKCGTYINVKAKRKDGLPTMMQAVQEDGRVTSLCTECIKLLGSIDKNDKESMEKFWREIEKNQNRQEDPEQ